MQRILLVDDDESVQLSLSALLEDEGFTVRIARSCSEARSVLSGDGAADLFLLDRNLGDGLGTDLIASIRDRFPNGKVVVLSGSIESGGSASPADAYFSKGGAFDDLHGLIRELLSGPGGEPDGRKKDDLITY